MMVPNFEGLLTGMLVLGALIGLAAAALIAAVVGLIVWIV